MSGWKSVRVVVAALWVALGSAYPLTSANAQNALEKINTAGEMQIGWAEWRPMEYRDTVSGDLKGVLIALADELASRLKVKPSFVQDNWATLTAGIAADKFQMALMGITEARQRVLDFAEPMYHVPFTVIVKDNSGLKTFDEVNTPENSIAVTTGSSTDELLGSLERSGVIKAKVIRLKDVGGALLSLTTDKTTAFASSVDALSQIVEQQKALRIVDGSFGASIFAPSHAKDQPELNKALNDAVKSMIEDGTIARLLVEYRVAGSVAGAQK